MSRDLHDSQDLHNARPAEQRPAAPTPGLIADDSGAVLMWTVFIALPVFFILGAMAVDAHRTYNTFDEAQSFADHTALAAAMELNGKPGAIERAIQAACGPGPGPLVTGNHTYGRETAGARPLNAGGLRFLSALGTDPSAPDQYAAAAGDTPICAASCAAPGACQGLGADVDADARFIEVTTAPVTVDWYLWPIVRAFGIADPLTSADAAARATAGLTKAVCNAPPLWMCNPLQSVGASLNDPQYVGMQIKAKSQGGGSQYAAGNFGLLNAFDGNGANELREAAASRYPTDQCTGYSVEFKTGAVTGPVEQGFNVRFDMYDGPMSSNKTDPLYPPAQNVTKGLVTSGGACKTDPSVDTVAIPRDSCFTTFADCSAGNHTNGTCNNLGSDRFGARDWDCAGYWAINHPGGIPMPAGCANPQTSGFTRWDLYQYEIDNNLIPDKSATGSENGNPTCSNQSWSPPDGQLDRREFIIAVVDCLDAAGNPLYNGAETNVPVRDYVRAFVTEAIGACNPSDKDVFIEYLGSADPSTLSDVFKEYPVLYR